MISVSPRRRTILRLGVTVSLISVILYSVGVSNVLRSLRGVDIVLFGAALAIGVIGVAISSLRWQVLLEPKGLNSGFTDVFLIYYLGSFLNLSMPSTIGGDSVRGYTIAGGVSETPSGYASVFMERLTGLIALVTFSTVAIFVYPHPIARSIRYALASGLLVTVILVSVSFFGRFDRRVDGLDGVVPAKLLDFLSKLYASVREYRDDRNQVYKALLLSYTFQLVPITTVFLLSRSMGLSVPLLFLFVMVPVSQLISFLPISFGGYGVREVVYVVFLSQVGISPPAAVGLAILVGIFTLVKNSVGAIGLLTRGAG